MTTPSHDPPRTPIDRAAVHAKLGVEAYSDHEVHVMCTVLHELYPEKTLADIPENEWLRAYGLMHQRKKTGWMDDATLAEKSRANEKRGE
ncbi:hypothetical protein [Deinococcus cavernae]|nr:hypothetical protein [Deinococcus cavernae]